MIFFCIDFLYIKKMPSRSRISDEDLVQIFGPSPLSRRRIRQRLGAHLTKLFPPSSFLPLAAALFLK